MEANINTTTRLILSNDTFKDPSLRGYIQHISTLFFNIFQLFLSLSEELMGQKCALSYVEYRNAGQRVRASGVNFTKLSAQSKNVPALGKKSQFNFTNKI